MGLERHSLPPVRFASKEELVGYINYHRGIFLGLIRGLSDIEIAEDPEGAIAIFKLADKPNDSREIDMKQAAEKMRWESPGEIIQIRVKVESPNNPLE